MKNVNIVLITVLFLASCKKEDVGEPFIIRVVDSWTGEPIPDSKVTVYEETTGPIAPGYKELVQFPTDHTGTLVLDFEHASNFIDGTHPSFEPFKHPHYTYSIDGQGIHYARLPQYCSAPIVLDLPSKCWIKVSMTDIAPINVFAPGFTCSSASSIRDFSIDGSVFSDGDVLEARARKSANQIEFKVHNQGTQSYPTLIQDIDLLKNDTIPLIIEY